MSNNQIDNIIEDQVNAKVSELSSWKQVRWEGGRLYYETQRILSEIKIYDVEIQILYLEKLLNKNFIVQDNWPHSAPDITSDLKNWIRKKLSELRIQQLSRKPNSPVQRERRISIPYRIRAKLQREINSRCPFCQNTDVDHFQFHHIDENPQNNEYVNLLMLCPICHSKITKRDISNNEVVTMKAKLLATNIS